MRVSTVEFDSDLSACYTHGTGVDSMQVCFEIEEMWDFALLPLPLLQFKLAPRI